MLYLCWWKVFAQGLLSCGGICWNAYIYDYFCWDYILWLIVLRRFGVEGWLSTKEPKRNDYLN